MFIKKNSNELLDDDIEKYNQSDKPISLFRTLRYQVPYSIIIGAILIVLIIAWYLIGLPLGIGGVVTI